MTAPILFDRRIVRLHRERAAKDRQYISPIVKEVTKRLIERLEDVTHSFTSALEIGGRGEISTYLQQRQISTVSCDLSYKMVAVNQEVCVCADEEALPFQEQSFDLIIANFTLHWTNDLLGTLIQIRKILCPDGLFLASIPIIPSFSAIRSILTESEVEISGKCSPRISPLPDLQSCASLMQKAGFALPVIDKEDIDLTYRDITILIKDLRAAGETNALRERERTFALKSFFAYFFEQFSKVESLEVPISLAMLTGWAPHPSQAKPLKPGQFSVSLEKALAEGFDQSDKKNLQ